MLKLQIVDETGAVVSFPGGGPAEADFRAMVAERITEAVVANTLARGVGFLASEAHVEMDLRNALAASLPQALEAAVFLFKNTYRPSLTASD